MNTFEQTGLNNEIVHALNDLDFIKPTPIQAECIPKLIHSETDIIALAQTGTGKTAAFSLPIIHNINEDSKSIQALILCPTRELCIQIEKDIKRFTKYLKNVKQTAVYGGDDIRRQIRSLKEGPQIVVGTPGRVRDLIKRKKLNFEDIRWLVLDEADEMLNMGFKEEIDEILESVPEHKQTYLFSATMPRAIETIARKYMNNPEKVAVAKESTGSSNVEHIYYTVHAKDRYEVLRRLADMTPEIYGIVFCRTRRETKEIADKLIQDHYNAEAIHGDLSQSQRETVMTKFRKKQLQILVATDVAARGIDVNNLTHVINFSLPENPESYVHRSGRTGRAHNKGISISIINMREKGKIRFIEKKIGKSFTQKNVPSGKEICEKQLFHLIDKIKKEKPEDSLIESYLPAIFDKLKDLSREDLIKHVVSEEFNRFLKLYENAPDIQSGGNGRDRGERPGRKNKENLQFTKFQINLGMKKGFGPKRLIETIIRNRSLKYVEIGKIDIGEESSYFEIDSDSKKEVLTAMNKSKFKGMPITVTLIGEGSTSTNNANDFESERRSSSKGRRSKPRRSNNNRSRGGFGGRKSGGERSGGRRKNSGYGKRR